MDWSNLGASIKSDAQGLVGNIAKAVLVFPDAVEAVNLEDPDAVMAYGKKMGLGHVDTMTAYFNKKSAGLKTLSSKAAINVTSLATTMKNVDDGMAGLNAALDSGQISGKKFTVQFNPSTIQIIGRGGGRSPISNYGSVGKDQPGKIEYKALDPYINVSFTVMFDATNLADAFMEERFTIGATTTVKNVTTAIVGNEYTVRPQVEGFLASLRDEDHRTMIFQWGSLRYTGVLNAVSASYTMFNTAGNPIRAQVQIGMLMGGAPKDSLVDVSYLDYWKRRYEDIIYKNADVDERGEVTSMTSGNIKNQYRNLINL